MIYLDYNASTPVDPVVREAMQPYLGEVFGNAGSGHAKGRTLRSAVDKARMQVAALLAATPDEIVFTSGGTEANNHVIKGVAHARRDRGRHIIVTAVEHPCVLKPCHFLESYGYEITVVPVDSTGKVDPQAVAGAVRRDTILVSVMHANNEVGTIEPIRAVVSAVREKARALGLGGDPKAVDRVWVHTDAAQSCGKIATRVDELGVDFLTVAGHKLYAPQGIGVLYIRQGIEIEPLLHGAGHEKGRRSGTEPVAAIVGLGAAAELAQAHLGDTKTRVLRDRLWEGLAAKLGDRVVLNGHPVDRLPNTLNVSFPGLIGRELLAAMPDLCASPGAACHGTVHKPSHVLAAMEIPERVALGAIRFSVGRYTTEREVDEAAKMIAAAASG